MQIWIPARKWVILGLFAVAGFFIYKYYYNRPVITKIIPKYIKTTVIKNVPVPEYKTVKVNHILYIPEKEYLKITQIKKIPILLKHTKILAVAKTPAYAGKTLVSCILKRSGKGEILIKQLPYQKILMKKKFFSVKPKFSLGAGYGFIQALPTITGNATYRFLRIGNIKFKVNDIYFNANKLNFIGMHASISF